MLSFAFPFSLSLLPPNAGVVSAVDSGDRLQISGPPRPNGPPLKKEITLASIQAPRLVREEKFFFRSSFFSFLFLLGRPSSLGAPSSFQPQPQPRPSRPLSLHLKLSSAPPPPPSPSRAAATAPPRTSPSPSRPASSSASSASAASALFGSTRRRKRRVEPSAPCLSAETTSRSRSHRQGSPR